MSNKNRDFVKQMTDKETRARFYDEMMDAINKNLNPPIPVPSPQPDAQSSLNEHYYIPKSATVRDLAGWLSENQGDPALRVSGISFLCRRLTFVHVGLSTSPLGPSVLAHQRAAT